MIEEIKIKRWQDSFYLLLAAISGLTTFSVYFSNELVAEMGLNLGLFFTFLRQKQKVWLLITIIMLVLMELRRLTTLPEMDWTLVNFLLLAFWWSIVTYYGFNCYRLYRVSSVIT